MGWSGAPSLISPDPLRGLLPEIGGHILTYLKLANSGTLFRVLHAIDLEVTESIKKSRCPHSECEGPLHSATYQRKPRGSNLILPESYCIRFGLCCGWCRRRVLPPSCLFFGRRVYFGVVVMLVTATVQGLHPTTINELCRHFEVSRRTVKRWVTFFETVFPTTTQWRRLRGRMPIAIHDKNLPRDLLLSFFKSSKTAEEGMILCLIALAKAECG